MQPWEVFLNSKLGKLPADEAREAAGDPTINAWRNAASRAAALGLANPGGEKPRGILNYVMAPLDASRAFVYATATELTDLARGDGWNSGDWVGKFERGTFDGEGFGSTEFLSTDDDDSLPMKVAKFGGSFVADVASDPLTYATMGGSTVAKTALGGLVKSAGRTALDDVTRAAVRQAGSEVGEEVARRGIVGDLARQQLKFGSNLSDEAAEEVLRRTPRLAEELAAERLGDALVSGRVAGTARTSRDAFRSVIDSLGLEDADDLTRTVMGKLDPELRGGLGFQVPFTRVRGSLTAGGGYGTDRVRLGRAADTLNRVRLGARATIRRPGGLMSKTGGQSSATYSEVLKDLNRLGVEGALFSPGAATAGTLGAVQRSASAANKARAVVMSQMDAASRQLEEAIRGTGDERAARSLANAVFNGDDISTLVADVDNLDAATARVVRAAEAARVATGYDGDVPRLVSADELLRRINMDPASRARIAQSDPSKRRTAFMRVVMEEGEAEADAAQALAREVEAAFNEAAAQGRAPRARLEAMTNTEINQLMGRQVYEDDAQFVLQRVALRRATYAEAEAIRDELLASGQLTLDPRREVDGASESLVKVQDALTGVVNRRDRRGQRAASRKAQATTAVEEATSRLEAARAAGDEYRAALDRKVNQQRKWVENAVANVRGEKRTAKAAVSQTQGAVKGAAAAGRAEGRARVISGKAIRRAQQTLVDVRTRIRESADRIERLTAEVDDLVAAVVAAEVSAATTKLGRRAAAAKGRITKLTARYSKLVTELDETLDAMGDVARREAAAADALEEAVTRAKSLRKSGTPAARRRADTAAGKAARDYDRVRNEYARLADKVGAQEKALAQLDESMAAAVDELAGIQKEARRLDVRVERREAATRQADRLEAREERLLNEVEAAGQSVDDAAARTQSVIDGADDAARRARESIDTLPARGREVEQLRAERDATNREVARARYGTDAERVEARNQANAVRAEERVDAQMASLVKAEDKLAEVMVLVNGLLQDTSTLPEVDRLFREVERFFREGGERSEAMRVRAMRKDATRAATVKDRADRAMAAADAVGLTRATKEVPGRARLPQPIEGFLTTPGVEAFLREKYRLANSKSAVRQALDDYVDPYMRFFKTWATVGRGPAYHARNFIGGMVNNWLIGVQGDAVLPAFRISRSLHEVRKSIDDDIAAGTLDPARVWDEFDTRMKAALSWSVGGRWGDTSSYEYARGFLDEGVQYARHNEAMERATGIAARGRAGAGGDSFAERTARSVARRNPTPRTVDRMEGRMGRVAATAARVGDDSILLDNGWIRWSAQMAEDSETFLRMSAYLEGAFRFRGDRQAASLFAKAAHFDYQDLTDFERALKFVVPFYTWTRYNIPFQLRQVLNDPGKLNRLESLTENLQQAFADEDGEDGLVPEWIRRRMGFNTGLSFPGTGDGSTLALMAESPQLDLFSLFGGDGLNPVRFEELADSTNPIIKAAFEVAYGRDLSTGQEKSSLEAARDLLPPVSQAGRLLGVTERDRERLASSWLSNVTGLPVATITPSSRRGEAMRRSERSRAKVNEALAPYLEEGEEIDPQWLRDIGLNNSPEQVLALIKAGYGRKGGPKEPEGPTAVESRAAMMLRLARGG